MNKESSGGIVDRCITNNHRAIILNAAKIVLDLAIFQNIRFFSTDINKLTDAR